MNFLSQYPYYTPMLVLRKQRNIAPDIGFDQFSYDVRTVGSGVRDYLFLVQSLIFSPPGKPLRYSAF